MSDGTTLIFRYDGSFDGLLCCIFESFYSHRLPERIIRDDEQITLFDVRDIETDTERAERVEKSIREKISAQVLDDMRKCFLSCAEDKDITILKFAVLGFKYGEKVTERLSDDTVNRMFRTVQNFSREAHFFREFLRFTENDGVLISVIEPKNFVLPYIVAHYTERLRNCDFMIYDKTHKAALIYRDKNAEIIPVDELKLPKADENELNYRAMWKEYYNIIGIEARYSDKRRMTMMPKRYWNHLTEFEDMYPHSEEEEAFLIQNTSRKQLRTSK